MHHCSDPYPIYSAGSGDRSFNPWLNAIDGKSVACGRCDGCVKNRKQAWTGKLVAESLSSQSVTFVTLTYKEDPDGVFRYEHIQEYLKAVRHWAWRKMNKTKVRFFCIGENGDLRGRVHWHMMLFFDKPCRLPVPKMGTHSQFWDRGWSNIQNLSDPVLIAAKARYCVSYAVKSVGGKGQRPRCSLRPALGHEWLQRHAHETAKAGLCPSGRYTLPGIVYSRGPKAGQSQELSIRGSQIRWYIKRYRASWALFHGERELPKGDWLLRYDDEAISPVFSEVKSTSRWLAPQKISLRPDPAPGRFTYELPPLPSDDNHWKSKVIVSPDGWSLTLHVCWWGRDRYQAYVWADQQVYYFDHSISEVLDLSEADCLRIDNWVRAVRGSDWSVDSVEKAKAEQAAQREREEGARLRRREVIRNACEESRSRQSLRVGVRLSAEAHPTGFNLSK